MSDRLHDIESARMELLGGISRRTMIRLRDNGTIPSIKIGRLVRFRESDILRFIESGGVPDYKTRRHC